MLNEIGKTNLFNENDMKYLNISNLFFNHPLTEKEIIELRNIFCSMNSISQIYFCDSIDIKSIEIVKYLLEISPMINDNCIEKYILTTNIEKDYLLNMNFQNPNSWRVAYEKNKLSYKTTSVLEYRKMENTINDVVNNIKVKKLSPLETLLLAYDYTKLFNYGCENTLPEIIDKRSASSYGYCLLFKEIIERLGFKSLIGNVDSNDSPSNLILVDILDEKYNVDGMYFFDPSSDSILKEESNNNDEIRKFNYNFFAITIDKFKENVFGDKLSGVLLYLSHDYEYDREKFEFNLSKSSKDKLLEVFGLDFKSIHSRIKDTKLISNNILLDLISTNINFNYWKELNIDIKQHIGDNYFEREDKIFKSNNIKTNILTNNN